jgi:hypothetical protein
LALIEGRAHEHASLLMPAMTIAVLTVIAGLTGRDDLVTEQMFECSTGCTALRLREARRVLAAVG